MGSNIHRRHIMVPLSHNIRAIYAPPLTVECSPLTHTSTSPTLRLLTRANAIVPVTVPPHTVLGSVTIVIDAGGTGSTAGRAPSTVGVRIRVSEGNGKVSR